MRTLSTDHFFIPAAWRTRFRDVVVGDPEGWLGLQ